MDHTIPAIVHQHVFSGYPSDREARSRLTRGSLAIPVVFGMKSSRIIGDYKTSGTHNNISSHFSTMTVRTILSLTTFVLGILLLSSATVVQPATTASLNISGYGEGTGFFHVESVPGGADVYMDGAFWGETPVTIGIASTAPPGHTVEVRYPGYATWSQFYPVNPRPGETVFIQAALVPLQATGAIYVTSSPPGASATVDGSASQLTPATFSAVIAGDHTVQVAKSGFQTTSKTVTVLPGQTTAVDFSLAPIPVTGSLQMTSFPSGADIYIDGVFKGETGVVIGNLAPGTHSVLLRLAGYQDWTRTVEIQPNQVTILSADLSPGSGSSNTGSITVTSIPTGATILMGGEFQGFTHPGSGFEITGLDPGVYNVTLLLPGYQDYMATVRVTSGGSSRVDARLVPSPIPPEVGAAVITSSPTGAEVFVDGIYSGQTPEVVQEVATGLHNLTISLNGYQTWSTTIQVQAGQTTQVTATLVQIPSSNPTRTGLDLAVYAGAMGFAIFAMRKLRP